MKIHAIILALNEEIFIENQLNTIYPYCSKISVITQYDRDWYGRFVKPDNSIKIINNYPDPEGKINLVIRRLPDEASARNMEMLSFNNKCYRNTISHGRPFKDIRLFHEPPDYFWIIDADEFYDVNTLPQILSFLEKRKPRGMRVTGYNYVYNWNNRVPRSVIDFTHFGFIKPGVLFEQRRTVSWNEFRIKKLLRILKLPDFSSMLFGFITCPESIGVFHHGCWIGDPERINAKFKKSSHKENHQNTLSDLDAIKTEFVPRNSLPINIQSAQWPVNFFCNE